MEHDVKVVLQLTNALLLRLLENHNVFRSISWETVGDIRAIYEENSRLLAEEEERCK